MRQVQGSARTTPSWSITGRERGKTGKVLRVMPDEGRVVVERLNMVKRHPSRAAPDQPGRNLEKEAPLAARNVMIFCDRCNAPVRIGIKIDGRRRQGADLPALRRSHWGTTDGRRRKAGKAQKAKRRKRRPGSKERRAKQAAPRASGQEGRAAGGGGGAARPKPREPEPKHPGAAAIALRGRRSCRR